MVGLEDTVLVRAEFLEFGLEELRFLVCNGFLVEDEDVGYVVRMNLKND